MANSARGSVAISAMLFLAACSSPTTTETKPAETKKEAAVPSEPVAAKTAFWEMYKPAHSWASDLLPLTLSSGDVEGMKNEDGKAAMWTAVFVSPSRREARTLTYSVVDHKPTIHKGVSMGGAQVWSGATDKSRPFQTNQFAIDSEVAFKTALGKTGDWVKKHPDKTWSMTLGNAARFPAPVWYVLWGDQKTGYGVFVNATTGALITGK